MNYLLFFFVGKKILKIKQKMTEYTLHYFSVRGRGELIRLIFKQAGKEFTDHRIPDFSAWPEEQKNGVIYHEFIFL